MKSFSVTSRPIVVHFDINETILLGDIAGGDSVEDCWHKIVAKSAFVQVPNSVTDLASFVPTHWWNGVPLQSAEGAPALWLESSWPPNAAPYYRTVFKRKSKTFLHHDGAVYRSAIHQIAVPPSEGCFAHILPALFVTLLALSSHATPVRIVFRTMGHDLTYIAEAITAFAQGKHPSYPDFVHEPFVWNRPEQFLKGYWENEIFGLKTNEGEVAAKGDEQVLQHLRQFSICGIQDDYHHWEKHGFRPEGGKPVWESDAEYHVLFDDNIFPMLPNYSIAGVRRHDKFVSCPEEGVHLIPVRTLAPLQNTNWFLEQLAESKKRYDNK
ncbi:hypothetical protein FisN_4Hh101 [Fistulifera solaris]|uniref:Uncharacterized protein n=1 Tax=Fistulifera solaris TaxID=1519565 RepID=A0A1Z5KE79_FISSO|nr:hypothetical protein FisN_4Hh101 [Fistulifera solaris]|eukprot:GAX24583.1 hypothetical protein FisN_4Hh101 [Fistulifera solaris]